MQLRINQLEMEVSNCEKIIEQNRTLEEKYNKSQQRFKKVFDKSQLGNKILNRDLLILEVNDALIQMLGYDNKNDIINRKILEFAHPDSVNQWHKLQAALWDNNISTFSLDTCLVRKDGSVIWCHVTSILFEDEGQVLGYTILENINDKKLLEIKINQLYKSFQQLFEMAPVSYLTLDREGKIITANTTAEKLFKEDKVSLKGKRIQTFIDSKDIFQSFNKGLFENQYIQSAQLNLKIKDGNIISTQFQGSLNDSGTESLIIITDLTLYNTAQENLKKSKEDRERLVLTMKIQEEERANLSEAVHNSLAQNIFALQLKIEKYRQGNDINQLIKELKQQVKPLYQEARNIAFELMPSTLIDFGIEEAISSICKKKSSPETVIEFVNKGKKIRFSQQFEIVLFRIIQELINNILKHANATKAKIEYSIEKDNVKILAQDNGVGFNTAILDSNKSKIGIRSIKNRISTLNGTFNLESTQGKETIITISIPRKQDF